MMVVFPGQSISMRREGEMMVLREGPGGLLLGAVTLHHDNIEKKMKMDEYDLQAVFSVFLLSGEDLLLAGSLPFTLSSDSILAWSLCWHPEGSLVALSSSSSISPILFVLDWRDLREDRSVSLLEFYSLFLAGQEVEEGSFGVNIELLSTKENVGFSGRMTWDRGQLVSCGWKGDNVRAVWTSFENKSIQLHSSYSSSFGVTHELYENTTVLVKMSCMVASAESFREPGLNYHVCDVNSSYGMLLGYSDSYFFVMQPQLTATSSSLHHYYASPCILLPLDDSRNNETSSISESSTSSLLNSDQTELESDLLDKETHGMQNIVDSQRILDVICLTIDESDNLAVGKSSEHRLSLIYCFLVEIDSCNCESVSYKLVWAHICNSCDQVDSSLSIRILCSHFVTDGPGFSELLDSNIHLELIQSSSNSPLAVLVQLKHCVQCIGVRNLVASISYRKSLFGVENTPTVLFRLDFNSLESFRSKGVSRIICSATIGYLLVAISIRDDNGVKLHQSVIHMIPLFAPLPHPQYLDSSLDTAIFTSLFSPSKGEVMVCGEHNKSPRCPKYTEASKRCCQPFNATEEFNADDECKVWPAIRLPESLHRDIVMNRCSFRTNKVSRGTDKAIAQREMVQNINVKSSITGGLICAVSSCDASNNRAYIASAVSVPHLFSCLYSQSNHLSHAHPPDIWIQSAITCRWKILRIPDSWHPDSILLLKYFEPSLTASLPPGRPFHSRKEYTEMTKSFIGI